MDVRTELRDLGFIRAGAIRPDDAGHSCRAEVEQDVQGFIVYAHVVGNEIKKFGTTAPRLKPRVHQNASTINGCIGLLDGRHVHRKPLLDLAPEVQ